jgi:hypothetical protein
MAVSRAVAAQCIDHHQYHCFELRIRVYQLQAISTPISFRLVSEV